MRVLTHTIPPVSNANYGGVLQAWALQEFLLKNGFDNFVDDGRGSWTSLPKETLRHLVALVAPGARVTGVLAKQKLNASLLQFADARMQLVSIRTITGRMHKRAIANFDAHIVGSDQVWRAQYVDPRHYLLDFVPASFSGPRVSYAASFGLDELTVAEAEELQQLGSAAQRFTAMSVREISATRLTQRLWGMDSQRVIDPTFLLTANEYRALYGSERSHSSRIVAYILDEGPFAQGVLSFLSEMGEFPVDRLLERVPSTMKEYRVSGGASNPSVEAWISRMDSANSIVTDSFHGCVFAILFNRPFLVLPNEARGATRLQTLLDIFGLSERMLSDPSRALETLRSPIDWEDVNARVHKESVAGASFLLSALSRPV